MKTFQEWCEANPHKTSMQRADGTYASAIIWREDYQAIQREAMKQAAKIAEQAGSISVKNAILAEALGFEFAALHG